VAYGPGDIPVERIETILPDLAPGDRTTLTLKFTEAHPVCITLDAVRPQGSSAYSQVWKP
jgi:hypothetical protein